MRPARSVPTVALLSGPTTLRGIDPLLRQAGVRLLRVATVEPTPVGESRWHSRVARVSAVDTVVVTSRAGVTAGVEPWWAASPRPTRALEFWAVGPGTARALRTAGFRRVFQPPTVGSGPLARALRRKLPRTVLYFRSDRAGPEFARSLRRQGHRVLDVVAYELRPVPRLSARVCRELASADVWIVTSPSSLSVLRRSLNRETFSRLTRTTPLVVLGERSRRATSIDGFRYVSVAPTTTAQRFTHHLLRELRDVGT